MPPEIEPEPVQSSTRTGTMVAALATPYLAPAIVPETCVPWPLQSVVPWPSLISVRPTVTLPPKSVCEASTPVSTT